MVLLRLVTAGRHIGYRHVLDEVWADAKTAGVALPRSEPVSAPGFSKARRKLDSRAIKALVDQAAASFYEAFGNEHRLHGRRVFAIDGTWISTQREWKLFDEFGGPSTGHVPQLTSCVLFDVIAKIAIDASIGRYASSERNHAMELIERHLRPGDVLLLDRGFPSLEFIARLRELKIDFVIRCSTKSTFAGVHAFIESEQLDALIVLSEKRSDLRVRAVRRPKKRGAKPDPFVLVTSLPRSQFRSAQVLALYRERWAVETFFRLNKGSYVGHGQFHAKAPDGIRQEIYAFLLFMTIARTVMAAAAIQRSKPYARLSQKVAILATTRELVHLVLSRDRKSAAAVLDELFTRITRCLEPKRRDRSCPRRSFKPRPKWGPNGKRDGRRARKRKVRAGG